MSHKCKTALRFFTNTVCVAAKKRLYWSIRPTLVRRSWQRKGFASSTFRLLSEMEHNGDSNQKAELLKTLENFRWLGSKTPCFPISGNKVWPKSCWTQIQNVFNGFDPVQVRVLIEPHSFYETIIEKASNAKQRITFASLYLGTGDYEKEVVLAIESALKKNPDSDLKVRILLDATRGSRGTNKNSRTMLLPLVQNFTKQCSINFYHTPALRGLLKKVLPERWNEVVGLQHMKIYIFDDTLLISGANLSHDYFTNRQDRYLVVEDCKDLSDFFDQLVETVCQFSLQMNENNDLKLNSIFPHHPFKSNQLEFTMEAKRRIDSLFEKQLRRNDSTSSIFQWSNPGSHDTWIFPFVQMGQLNIFMDNVVTRQILENIPQNAELCLATGYFNLTQDYMNSLVEASQPNIHILMAHPLVCYPAYSVYTYRLKL